MASSQDRTPWEEALSDTVWREAGRRTATGEPLPPESMTARAGEARGPRVITATTSTQPTQPVTQPLTDGQAEKGWPVPGTETSYLSLWRPLQIWCSVRKAQGSQKSK